jgi:xanthine dehydrogenase accessory factor
MIAFWQELADLARAGVPFVLVTVLEAEGSAPREGGAKMAVTAERALGTIGGGRLEFTAIETARAMLDGVASAPVTRRLALGPTLGQCCGGTVTLLFEPTRPPALDLALFGAGHVARALVAKLADLPCRITWIDPRADEFPAMVPVNVTVRVTESPEGEVEPRRPGTHYLVMSHDHALDLLIVGRVLKRADFAWLGLIGSSSKRARFTARLRRMGFAPETLDRLVCPIGLPGLTGKTPGEIALSVAAQLMATLAARAENAPASVI